MASNNIDPNQTKVDLTTCDREPIHIVGRVQAFGALVSVTADWIVNHASDNLRGFVDLPDDDIVGLPLSDVFSEDALHTIRGKLQMLRSADAVERVFGLALTEGGSLHDVAVHISGRSIIMEIEHHDPDSARDYVSYVRPMIDRIKSAATVEDLCQVASRQLTALTGFDRVMVYRFADDGAGEVIAETRQPNMDPFLGLRYPASDIPKQARAIYKRNLLRIISDVNDVGAKIEPAIDPDGVPLDLSMSTTRAVSPIHLEYLRNMGVEASMSISVLRRGELWGLFACHHRRPKILSYDTRTAAELFAQLFAFVLDQKLGDLAHEESLQARILHDRVMVELVESDNIGDNIERLSESVQSVIPFDGVVTWIDGQYRSRGSAPTREQFLPISRLLNTAAVSQIYTTDNLTKVHPKAADFVDVASGMLALPVSRSPRDYMVLFRKELIRSVKWAGNPEKPAELGPNGIRLTPRKSFEAYAEAVHGHCSPWTDSEKRAAEALRMTLLELVLRLTDSAMKERSKAQQQQELLIAELNHRVRNILNLIKGLVSQSAAKAYLGDLSARISIKGSDAMLEPTAFTTVSLVIHEMMTNSAKYGALTDQHGHVEINLAKTANGSLSIDWQERGGPPVNPPTRKGFGTTIIERSIPYELHGTSDITYELTGVKARFTIPEEFIDRFTAARAVAEADTSTSGKARLSGSVLVVEDNMIIAMDAEDILMTLGATNVTVAASVDQALSYLEQQSFTFAMLDVNLGAQTSETIAIALTERGTPFIFATGYGDRTSLSDRFPDIGVVQKPYDVDRVAAALPG